MPYKAPQIEMRMELELLDFDIDKFHKGLFDFGNRLIRKAGRAFCQEIYNNVPVWSGMALASIKPLARAVRFGLVVTPREGAPDRRAQGESLGGQHPLETDSVAGTANMDFSFNWATDVEHFNIHDQRNMSVLKDPKAGYTMTGKRVKPAWKALDKAQQAAKKVIDDGMANVPKPTDYMVRRQITFDPENGGSLNLGF